MGTSYSFKNVSKKYKKRNCFSLKSISFELPDTGLISFVGPSGSGKTTILNLLGCIDRPTEGEIFYNGYNLTNMSRKQLDLLLNNDISFVFQDYNLLFEMNVYENILLGLEFQQKIDSHSRIIRALEMVGLDGYESRKINTLSGGELQRVAIARSIVRDSKVILADEITANLDESNSIIIFELLKKLSKTKLVVLVTHDIQKASQYCDRMIKLSNGEMLDNDSSISLEDSKNYEPICKSLKANRAKVSPLFFLKNFFGNVLNSKIITFFVFVMMVAVFSLNIAILSLYKNDESTSYCNTFKLNNEYILPVSKYIEDNRKTLDSLGNEKYVGPRLANDRLKFDDVDDLSCKIQNDLPICLEYFYNSHFGSYLENGGCNYESSFYSNSFKNIVSISDFSKFNAELKQGKKPELVNEILIYDYMEKSLINAGIIDNTAIGKELYDRVNDIRFVISGVIKSNYVDYSYLEKSTKTSKDNYARSYLNQLETIYCHKDFFETITSHKKFYFSDVFAYKIRAKSGVENQTIDLPNVVSYGSYDVLTDFNYDYLYQNAKSNSFGFIISKKTAMKIAGVDSALEFDMLNFETENTGSKAFIETFDIRLCFNVYDRTISPSYSGSSIYSGILGVTNDIDNEYIYFVNSNPMYYENFSFRGISILLSNDWSLNKKVISKLIWPNRTNNYYDSFLDGQENEDYTIYSPLSAVLNDAEKYVPNVVSTARNILIYASI